MNTWFNLAFFLTCFHLQIFAQETGLPRVHSHNDYEQERPFWEAYEAGCGSIEVDVFLRNDTLFVAHEAKEITTERTLEVLYLQPIGQILQSSRPKKFQLLVDVKTEAKSTLELFVAELQKRPEFTNQDKVKFVISGNRPAPEDYKNYPTFIFFDHQTVEDLDNIELDKIALISLPFYKTAFWNGKDELPEESRRKIMNLVKLIHSKNLPFRFWATPDTELSWKTMSELGIDFVNTDKPKACSSFLLNK